MSRFGFSERVGVGGTLVPQRGTQKARGLAEPGARGRWSSPGCRAHAVMSPAVPPRSRSPTPIPGTPPQSPRRAGRRSPQYRGATWHLPLAGPRGTGRATQTLTPPQAPAPRGRGRALFSLDHQVETPASPPGPAGDLPRRDLPGRRASGRAHRGLALVTASPHPQQRHRRPHVSRGETEARRGEAACRRSRATEVGTLPEP